MPYADVINKEEAAIAWQHKAYPTINGLCTDRFLVALPSSWVN